MAADEVLVIGAGVLVEELDETGRTEVTSVEDDFGGGGAVELAVTADEDDFTGAALDVD